MRLRPDGYLEAENFAEHMAPDITWVEDPEFAAAFAAEMEHHQMTHPVGELQPSDAGLKPSHHWKWGLDRRLRKKKGSSWTGRVVGFYSTRLTPIGYAIESETETGSVQIYPESALEEA